MKIESVTIKNFRVFKEETISLDDYTCLVGPNGVGKSTILTALNIFFRESGGASTDLTSLTEQDFHNYDTSQCIEITITFGGLSEEAKSDLQDYVRQDKLIVSAVAEWNEATKSAEVKQYGQRLGIQEFRSYFEKEKEKASAKELVEFFGTLQQSFSGLKAAKTKPAMEEALHEYEAAHPEQCTLIESEDQFYGISRGANRIQKYLQWVYIPAVKDATTEQVESKNTALGRLLARRVRSSLNIEGPVNGLRQDALRHYRDILQQNSTALGTLSDSLNKRFQRWAHQYASVKLDWQNDEDQIRISEPTAEVEAAEGIFKGKLARFGHGLQRSFIFALLEEQAEHSDTGPTLVFACEEPELYQHPPQARYLASLLQKLSTQNAQILVCTHSPYFVTGRSFEHVRVVSKDNQTGQASVNQASFEDIAEAIAGAKGERPTKPGGIALKVEQDLQVQMSEMFFAAVRIFVEGLEDIGYISSYLTLLGLWDEFRALGCHLVQVQGKSNLVYALAVSNSLNLPSFTIFDADGNTPADTPQKATGARVKHEKDNLAILQLCDVPKPEAFPTATLWGEQVVVWPNQIGEIVEQEIGSDDLRNLKEAVTRKYGLYVHDKDKNILFIGYVMAEAWDQGKKSPTLEKLCRAIIDYAKVLNTPAQREVKTAAAPIPTAAE